MSTQVRNDLSSRVLVEKLREHGLSPMHLWTLPGPDNSQINDVTAWLVNSTVVLVQSFKHGSGWEAYTPCQSNNIDETVADVIARVTPVAHRA